MNFSILHYQETLAALVLVIITSLIIINYRWKICFDKKNIQLMQLYMELKFLHKNINEIIINEPKMRFCSSLIESIKEYYNLEDFIVADNIKIEAKAGKSNSVKSKIYSFLVDNELAVKNGLKDKDIITQILEISGQKYILYIFPIDLKLSNNGFIICVENYPSLINESELIGLKSNISLLRIKLLSD